MTSNNKIKLLMDLRPALDGHYGIPQETRLLFGAIAKMPQVELSGLLQMATRMTRGGVASGKHYAQAEQIYRYSRTVVAIKGNSVVDWKQSVGEFLEEQLERWMLRLSAWLGIPKKNLSRFESKFFEDFVWQAIFANTLPSDERKNVVGCDYKICATPWRWMHQVGIDGYLLFRRPTYPRLNLLGHDIFIAQTPYPGRVCNGTALIVHYHDAIPVLMPHTITDRTFHQASHFHALTANVRDGAWFVCVSEATRNDLIGLFPEAAPRAVVIHNMLPSHYYPCSPEPERVAGIVRRYQYGEFIPPKSQKSNRTYKLARCFGSEADKTAFYEQAFGEKCRFLLMVSTIEPRKNHQLLLEAWGAMRDLVGKNLKLVFVGHIGWDYENILDSCESWIEQGGLFMLHSVPADALRVLYRNALVTVCPSVGEGFDFSGVEAMRCGGVVAASDIAVHREVYGNAAEYFDPYDTASLLRALRRLIDAPDSDARREALRRAGEEQSARYLPERVMPQFEAFLTRVAREIRMVKSNEIANNGI